MLIYPKPFLYCIDTSNADLTNTNLTFAKLHFANLSNVNLTMLKVSMNLFNFENSIIHKFI